MFWAGAQVQGCWKKAEWVGVSGSFWLVGVAVISSSAASFGLA
jgi:hypothetical protein